MNRKDNALRMRNLVTAFRNSEMNLTEFARTQGISRGKLQYWVRNLGKTKSISIEGSGNFIPIDLPFENNPEPRYIIINKPCGTQIKIPF